MLIDVPNRVRPYVAADARRRARQLRRDGFDRSAAMPDDLAALLERDVRDAADRRRKLSAARSRRYRGRKRAQRQAASAASVA